MLMSRLSPRTLRRLLTKLALKANLLQTPLYLTGVPSLTKSVGSGGFAEVWTGKWNQEIVAIKRPYNTNGMIPARESLR